jgi:iron complex outermembrane receptor protein
MVDGEPLTSISVSLLAQTANPYRRCRYIQIRNLNAGQYTIKLQILGSKEVRLPVEVKAGEKYTTGLSADQRKY